MPKGSTRVLRVESRDYHLTRRPSAWYAYWIENGKRRYRSTKATKLSDAMDIVRGWPIASASPALLRQIAEPLFLPGSSFLARKAEKAGALRESTRLELEAIVRNYVLPRWGEYPLNAIQESEVEDWLDTIRRVPRKRAQEQAGQPILSNAYRNRIIEVFGMIYDEARRRQVVDRELKVERYSRRRGERRVRHQDTLTPAELSKLLPADRVRLREIWSNEHAQRNRYREPENGWLMFAVMAAWSVSTGLRSGEVRALHRDQIDEDLSVVYVVRALDEQGNVVPLKKGSDEDPRFRVVVVPTFTMDLHKQWVATANPDGLLFRFHGNPVDPKYLRVRLDNAIARAGIDVGSRRIRYHSLRYTYRTLAKTHIPAAILDDWAGHRDGQTADDYDRPHLEQRALEYQPYRGAVDAVFGREG